MYNGAALVRRTPLAEKVFARAAQIESVRLQREAALNASAKAMEDTKELSRRIVAKRQAERPCAVYARIQSHLKRIRVRDVLKASCRYFHRAESEITGNYRIKEVTIARHVGMYVAYRYCETSLPAIAQVYQRDHTTVLSGIRRIQALIDAGDRDTICSIECILEDVRSVSVEDQPYWGA